MELERFIALQKQFEHSPQARNEPEYGEWMDAFQNDGECKKWELQRRIKSAGINYDRYCCTDMAYMVTDEQTQDDPEAVTYNSVINYYKNDESYGLPMHSVNNLYIKINYCPWCGAKL